MRKTSLLLLIPILLLTACGNISEEEAIEITQEFVNSQVKFFVSQDLDSPVVNRAAIAVLHSEKIDGNWNILLNIKSNYTGELKQADMRVVIDKKGNIIKATRIEKT